MIAGEHESGVRHNAGETRFEVMTEGRLSVVDYELRELIAEGDQIAPFAELSTRSAKADHGALFPEKDFKKATIETWLAWQEEPGMTFGTAFQKDCLQKNQPLAERFVAWVRKLIADSQSP